MGICCIVSMLINQRRALHRRRDFYRFQSDTLPRVRTQTCGGDIYLTAAKVRRIDAVLATDSIISCGVVPANIWVFVRGIGRCA